MQGFGDWADLAIQSRPRGASNYHISSQLWDGTTKPNATTSYTSNGLNQYTAITGIGQTSIPPTHDANGNLTAASHWQYSYDSDNRLKTATSTDLATAITASLTYDAQGRLRQTQINTAGANPSNKSSQLLYDGVDLIAEYDTSTNAIQRRYVHGPGVDEPLVWYEGSGTGATANKNWLYADHLGSIIATANASGSASAGSGTVNTYGPFGESAQTTPDNNRFGYTGQQQLKGLGLYYYKARIYSPALGRFLQTDPIGGADDLNLYSYVGNGAVNANDPSGLACNSSGGMLSCTTPGGVSFSVPSPGGFPANISPGQQNYHAYSIPVGPTTISASALFQGIVNQPTPGPSYLNGPATPQGRINEATPNFMYSAFLGATRLPSGTPVNPVASYLTKDQDGNQLVVNVTLPGHALFPGYVARRVTSSNAGSIIQNEGEGLSPWQAPGSPIADQINNAWKGQSQSITDAVRRKGS